MLLAVWCSTGTARAHIRLLQPASWIEENLTGDPQKAGPCGTSDARPGVPTGAITTYRAGETITVEWQETIYHPGHFRIALAADRSQLVDPAVTTTSSGISLSAEISDPPVYPVLLDNLYPRSAASGADDTTFTQAVRLPATPCEKCTLQVIQFMAQHGVPYVYHHCADVRIVSGGANADAGSAVPSDGGVTQPGQDATLRPRDADADAEESGDDGDAGEGCAVAVARASGIESSWLSLVALSLFCRRLRSRTR